MMSQKKTKKAQFKLITKSSSSAQVINISSRSGKISSFLNFIRHQYDIEKIYLYATDPHDTKYYLWFDKQESTELKHVNNF